MILCDQNHAAGAPENGQVMQGKYRGYRILFSTTVENRRFEGLSGDLQRSLTLFGKYLALKELVAVGQGFEPRVRY